MNSLKGKTRLIFAGAVAALVVLTFGIMLKGVYLSLRDGAGAAKTEGAGKQAAGASPAVSSAPSPAAASAPQSLPDANAVAAAFRVKRILKIDGPLRHGDYHWDDKDVPAGPVVVTVDLKAQTLSVFRAGYEIGAAVILYGATDKPSPLGVFPVMRKIADYHSRTYDNAPMPFTLWLTNDGVAIHGSDVEWGRATHGCIGVPTPFAKKLFAAVQPGDPVIITNGKMMQVN